MVLKDEVFRMKKQPNYMTVPAVIRELEKIEMAKGLNGRYRMYQIMKKKYTRKVFPAGYGRGYWIIGISGEHSLDERLQLSVVAER